MKGVTEVLVKMVDGGGNGVGVGETRRCGELWAMVMKGVTKVLVGDGGIVVMLWAR